MCIISGITTGRIMHHCHPAQFIQGRADTGYVSCVNRYNSVTLSHMQLSHPHPFRMIRSSGSFSSCQASVINSAVLRIPSNPYSPAPSTRLTKCLVPVNHAAFCPIASTSDSFLGFIRISGRIVGSYSSSGYCSFSHSNVSFSSGLTASR